MNIYLDHLKNGLYNHKLNTIKQHKKSDIDPYDYCAKAERWYDQIFRIIETTQPIDNVASIEVFQDSLDNIKRIAYVYFRNGTITVNVSIDIFWI